MKLHQISENLYEFALHGKVTKAEIEEMSNAFQEFKDRNEKINLLAVFESFPSLDSVLSVSATFKMKFKSLAIINKYAILVDADWMENLIPIANFLTPSFPIKAFEKDERDEAIAWLNQNEEEAYDPKEHLSGVEIEKIGNKTYSLNLEHKRMNHASMVALNSILDNLEVGEKIKMMVLFDKFPTLDSFKTFIEGLKVDFRMFGRLEKYAIVSDLKWIEAYAEVGDFLTPGIEVKAFERDEVQEAIQWLAEEED